MLLNNSLGKLYDIWNCVYPISTTDKIATKRNNTSVLIAVAVVHVDDFLDDHDDDVKEPLLGEFFGGDDVDG